jgi:hypothetical protein
LNIGHNDLPLLVSAWFGENQPQGQLIFARAKIRPHGVLADGLHWLLPSHGWMERLHGAFEAVRMPSGAAHDSF